MGDNEGGGSAQEPNESEEKLGKKRALARGNRRTHRKTRWHLSSSLFTNLSFHVAFWFTLGSVAWVVNGLYIWYLQDRSGASNIATWSGFVDPDHPSTSMKVRVLRWRQDRHYEQHREKIVVTVIDPEHYDAAYLGSLVQLAAATVFGFAAVITGTFMTADNTGTVIRYLFFWVPQVIGGVGFVGSTMLFWCETGLDKVRTWGWWVCLCNMVGSIGFLTSGVCGMTPGENTHVGAMLLALLSLYGSVFFLLGSLLQLWEVFDT
ncbi:hypothetical protein SeLEV6574_g07836 [Synchytrium endobioticum]|nr:hypothetical protein SeLEV6574_g07836 [Synchytrium endobioticum]